MTCIVAVVENGVPYFAGDSLVVNLPGAYYAKANQTVRREPKIFQKNGMFFGYNGSVRMGQLLRYIFEPPAYTPGQDKVRYLVTRFIKDLQACFGQAKFEQESLEGGILLAIEGELFTISQEFGVCNTANAYEAIGQGAEPALGSLHTTAQLGLPPRERLHLALKAAEHHTCVVNAPFTYLTTEMDQAELLLPAPIPSLSVTCP